MDTAMISDLIGSSQYKAIADDALKDEDNVAWVMELEPEIRQEWIERIGWVRLADRLAENELVDFSSSEFHTFCLAWNRLFTEGHIQPDCPYREVLSDIRDRCLGPEPSQVDQLTIQSWNEYLEALTRYHKNNLVIDTLEQYETMLHALSGSCFQVLPFLQAKYWPAVYAFGALDQFFNNLRDILEDAEQEICYLPTELLERFDVSRDEILQFQASKNPNYIKMMAFLLDEYLPTLYQKTQPLLAATDLHPSWKLWRDWSFHRYRRIERVFRSCNFDYTLFPQAYWAEVKQDLPLLLQQVRSNTNQSHTAESNHTAQNNPTAESSQAAGDIDKKSRQEEIVTPNVFLLMSKKVIRGLGKALGPLSYQKKEVVRQADLC